MVYKIIGTPSVTVKSARSDVGGEGMQVRGEGSLQFYVLYTLSVSDSLLSWNLSKKLHFKIQKSLKYVFVYPKLRFTNLPQLETRCICFSFLVIH